VQKKKTKEGVLKMKNMVVMIVIIALIFSVMPAQAFAENTARHGDITGKTVVSGLVSLIIWPGLGQYINNNETKKNVTHALIGLFPPFRFWSGWDALIDRQGGRWDGKI
jgi:MFS-type transporter involved in bile tolerance (Atg22 family)